MKWNKNIAAVFYKYKDKSVTMDPRPHTEFSKFIDSLASTWEFEDEDHLAEFMTGETNPSFFDYADKFNVELVDMDSSEVLMIEPNEEEDINALAPGHVKDVQGKIVQAVEKAHRVTDTNKQMEQVLRRTIQNEIAKALSESMLNETAQDYAMQAKDFCRSVLKLGSRQNVFDRYMKAKQLDQNDLDEFMVAVAMELKNNWLKMYKDQI